VGLMGMRPQSARIPGRRNGLILRDCAWPQLTRRNEALYINVLVGHACSS
jgi:hypothetical protein